MLKILYLVTQSELGGAQRYVADLAINLPKDQYEVAVAAGGQGPLFNQLKSRQITVLPLKNLIREINPLKDLKAFFEIKKLIKELKPDIVHLNSSKAGVLGALAAKQAGVKKVIYTVHGFVFNEPMAAWKKLIYQRAEKFSSRYKDVLICVSEFDRQVGLNYKIAPEKKLVTINNGIKTFSFLDDLVSRTQLNLPTNKIIIGTVANFYPTKDLSTLIKAASIIKKQRPEVIFTIIGDGLLRQSLETEIKQLNLTQNFILLGQRDNAGRYLPAFNLYVCSSVKEGFPFSILEAMAAGLPIISTNVGGISELIKDNYSGLLVEPKNPQALAEAIIKLLQNKNLADQLGRQARSEVKEKFSLERMIQQTAQLYN